MKTKQKQPVTQLSVFSQLPATHEIAVTPIPEHLSLRVGLAWIVISKVQGDETTIFQLPVQWSRSEAAALIHEIRGVVWQLGDDGKPCHLDEIVGICEEFCKFQQQSKRLRDANEE